MGNKQQYAYGGSGNYLKGTDIAGKSFTATITGVEDIEFDKGLKPVLSFSGRDKRLVLNSGNFDTLAEAYGGFTEKWIGKPVTVKGDRTTFQNKRVDCVRVSIPQAAPKADLYDEGP
jgi:hypothetical protein